MSETTVKPYIVVAEDDKSYAEVYKLKLEQEGFEVDVCENGQIVLNTIATRKPKLILMDIMMPLKNGFETVKEIRQNKDYDDIKIIMMSNLGQDEDIKKAKDLGADDYLIKADISIKQMVQNVKKYLS